MAGWCCSGRCWSLWSVRTGSSDGRGGVAGRDAAGLAAAGTRNRVDEDVGGFAALWGEVAFVLRYVRTDRLIGWGVVQWTIGSTLALIVATLAPTFVVVVLGIRAEDSVFVLASAGIGTVLGSALLTRWGDRVDRRRLVERALMLGLLRA